MKKRTKKGMAVLAAAATALSLMGGIGDQSLVSVSYTHLDVYKRQALFTTPTKAEALETIRRAEKDMDEIISLIKKRESFPKRALGIQDKMNSGIVNDLFYPMFVHAKKFYATDACISCGKCVKVCPLNNIYLEKGKPVWERNCTHCMACICRCPSQAIEYGKHSKGLPRYTCPK